MAQQQQQWLALWGQGSAQPSDESTPAPTPQPHPAPSSKGRAAPASYPQVARTAQRHAVAVYRSAPLVITARHNVVRFPRG